MKKKKTNKRLRTAFGSALKRLRERRGFTQETLGFEASFDRTYISLIERGINSPTLDSLGALCTALDITLSRLAIEVEKDLARLTNVIDD